MRNVCERAFNRARIAVDAADHRVVLRFVAAGKKVEPSQSLIECKLSGPRRNTHLLAFMGADLLSTSCNNV